ncbi:MAG: hypothetical protein E6370_12250 [Clostridiales bacterium]|nr:hypothetical protein [Clostridiales bacterium]
MAFLGAMYMYAYVFMQIPTGILEPRRTITLGMGGTLVFVSIFKITSD